MRYKAVKSDRYMKNAHKGFLLATFVSYVLLYSLIALLS
jgi:hypothetical protein